MRSYLLEIIGGVFILYLLAMEVIDMASRYEYLENHAPGLLRWAEKKWWHRVLLLTAVLLLAANFYETAKGPELPTIVFQTPPIAVIPASSSPKESPNSLRRRTVRLANEIERWQTKMYSDYPNPNGPNDDTLSKRRAAYDAVMNQEYLQQFRDRTVEVVKALESKGLDVGPMSGEWGISKRMPVSGETGHLKDLAYRLDAYDNVVRF